MIDFVPAKYESRNRNHRNGNQNRETQNEMEEEQLYDSIGRSSLRTDDNSKF